MSFPERDTFKPAEQQGIFNKFTVIRNDGSDQPGGKHEGCHYFVLDLDHDPHARDAIKAYASSCAGTHPELAKDLMRLRDQLSQPKVSFEDLVNKAVKVLNRHIVPDGISDKDALTELYEIFDGPEYRAAKAQK